MKIKFNKEVLDVINAVRDYKRFIISNNYVVDKNNNFDWYAEAENYFKSLPLPKELNPSKACFEAIIFYPEDELKVLNDTNYSDLHYHEFGY